MPGELPTLLVLAWLAAVLPSSAALHLGPLLTLRLPLLWFSELLLLVVAAFVLDESIVPLLQLSGVLVPGLHFPVYLVQYPNSYLLTLNHRHYRRHRGDCVFPLTKGTRAARGLVSYSKKKPQKMCRRRRRRRRPAAAAQQRISPFLRRVALPSVLVASGVCYPRFSVVTSFCRHLAT